MERNGIERAIYVGDTMGDCEAARAAGIPFLHAAYGFGSVPDAPAVRAFSEIPAAIEKMLP
jgi:phosphoglycolate phosphatase